MKYPQPVSRTINPICVLEKNLDNPSDRLRNRPPHAGGGARGRGGGDALRPGAVRVVAPAHPPEGAAAGGGGAPPLANRFLHVPDTPAVDGWIDGRTAGFSLPAGGRVSQPNRERT